ncbi:unnamed protein product, partial [Ilex paraguariensis]
PNQKVSMTSEGMSCEEESDEVAFIHKDLVDVVKDEEEEKVTSHSSSSCLFSL